MSVTINNSTNKRFSFDYRALITDVIKASCDYVCCPFTTEVSVSIVDDEEICRINKEYRDIDKPTDVLSFPMQEYENPGYFKPFSDEQDNMDFFNYDTREFMLGDIIISYDRVKSQA